MMKCNMCYDRTSAGKKPMCATVCPSQALYYGTREEIERMRPDSVPMDTFKFGNQTVNTKVKIMMPMITSCRSRSSGSRTAISFTFGGGSRRIREPGAPDDARLTDCFAVFSGAAIAQRYTETVTTRLATEPPSVARRSSAKRWRVPADRRGSDWIDVTGIEDERRTFTP